MLVTMRHYTSQIQPEITAAIIPTPMLLDESIYRELAEQVRIEAEYSESDHPTIIVETERDGNLYVLELGTLLTFDHDTSPCGRPLVWLRKIQHTFAKCDTFDRWGDQHRNDFNIHQFIQYL